MQLIKKYQKSGKIEEGRSTGKPINFSKKKDIRMHNLHGIPQAYTREIQNPNASDLIDFYNEHGYSLNTQLKNNKQDELQVEVSLTEPISNKFIEVPVLFDLRQEDNTNNPSKAMTRTTVVGNKKYFSSLPLTTKENIPIKYRILNATPENIEGSLENMNSSLFNTTIKRWKKYQGKFINPHSQDSAIFNINNGFSPEEFKNFIIRK